MDKFKEKTFNDYDTWDMNWKCIKKNAKQRKKLSDLFKRKARRKLKQELDKEVRDGRD